MHPRLEWIISVLTEFADVAMVTNGSILYTMNPDIIKKLNTIQFSIYGRDNTEYKKLTGVADGFDRLVKSLQMAKDNHIPFYASLTLSESTFEYAEEFIQTAIDLGVKNLVIGVAECFGRGLNTKDTEETVQKQIDEALRKIVHYKHKYRNQILLMLPNISTDHIDSHEDVVNNVFGYTMNCGCGSEFMVLAQNGKYRPCQSLPEEFFSIDSEDALSEHINGDFHLAQLYEGTKKFYEINRFNEKANGPCSGLDSIYYRKLV